MFLLTKLAVSAPCLVLCQRQNCLRMEGANGASCVCPLGQDLRRRILF